jgi:hypothetical protein
MLRWIRPLGRTAALVVGAAALSGCPDDRAPKPKAEVTASAGATAFATSPPIPRSASAERASS